MTVFVIERAEHNVGEGYHFVSVKSSMEKAQSHIQATGTVLYSSSLDDGVTMVDVDIDGIRYWYTASPYELE